MNHESGNITKILVNFHYDDYRRVTIEERNYFFAPLEGTPFGLAIALPKYGTKWIEVCNFAFSFFVVSFLLTFHSVYFINFTD